MFNNLIPRNLVQLIVVIFIGITMTTDAQEIGGIVNVVGDDGKAEYYYSILPHEEIFERGLISEAIAGKFLVEGELDENTVMDGSNFSQNPAYLKIMHKVIGEYGPQHSALIAEAKRQMNGVVAVIDRRVKNPNDRVPPEDIIGLFEVKESMLMQYQANPNYILWTDKGFSNIDAKFAPLIIQEIRKLYK
jgi:hypothetical protein